MNLRIFLCAAAILLTNPGCIFSKEPYKAPAYFDTAASVQKCNIPAGRLRVRNISGADRRFFYKLDGGRAVYDTCNSWVIAPEQLLERALEETFNSGKAGSTDITCTIGRFEFDVPQSSALLSLSVIFEKNGVKKSFTVTEKEKYSDGSASSGASAMDICIRKAVEKICRNASEFNAEKEAGK